MLDPYSGRTFGLITKPDTLDVGSDSERAYLELAQNKDVKFRLSWHVRHHTAGARPGRCSRSSPGTRGCTSPW
jgi:hypothetical protein